MMKTTCRSTIDDIRDFIPGNATFSQSQKSQSRSEMSYPGQDDDAFKNGMLSGSTRQGRAVKICLVATITSYKKYPYSNCKMINYPLSSNNNSKLDLCLAQTTLTRPISQRISCLFSEQFEDFLQTY